MLHPLVDRGRPIQAGPVFLLILLILMIALAVAPVLVPAVARAQDAKEMPPVPESWEEVGLKDYGLAPEISLELADGSGKLKLSELVEHGPVLVDFWATWCGPCRMAMPQYAALYEEYREQGFNVLAVSEDSPQAAGKVLEFMEKMELPFPVVLDPKKEAGKAYYVRSLPTAYLIDRRGHVVGVEIGYAPGRERHLAKQIEVLLETEGAPGVEG